mgnify:FL=1
MNLPLILASQSPRRKALLAQLGYQFQCISADIDESVNNNETPQHYVERLALAKAAVIAKQQSSDVTVIGSDTTVT